MAKSARSYSNALAQLNRYLHENEKRPSRVREMVLAQVFQLPQPFTAEQLVKACEAERISVGTVYNSLNLFIDARLLRATVRQRGKSATEYELLIGATNKVQFICKKCGRTVEFSDQQIARSIKTHGYNNFLMQNYNLTVYGECKICRKKVIRAKSKAL